METVRQVVRGSLREMTENIKKKKLILLVFV